MQACSKHHSYELTADKSGAHVVMIGFTVVLIKHLGGKPPLYPLGLGAIEVHATDAASTGGSRLNMVFSHRF
jgi:hypothetical protein